MEFLKSEGMKLFLNCVLIISCTKIFILLCLTSSLTVADTKIHDKSRFLFCTTKQFQQNTKTYLLRFSSVIFNRMLILKYYDYYIIYYYKIL